MEIRQNPNRKLERLVLGPYENSYWVAIDDRRDGYVSFISHETDHDCKITFESLLGVVSEPEIKFFSLSLGGHFAIGANGWNHSSYAPLRDILQNTPESKEGIQVRCISLLLASLAYPRQGRHLIPLLSR